MVTDSRDSPIIPTMIHSTTILSFMITVITAVSVIHTILPIIRLIRIITEAGVVHPGEDGAAAMPL